MGLLDNPNMAMAMSLLANSGYSRTPRTFGQNIGEAFGARMQAEEAMRKRQMEQQQFDMQQEEFAMKKQEMAAKLAEQMQAQKRMEMMRSSPGMLGYGTTATSPQAQGLLSQTAEFGNEGISATNQALDYADPSGGNTPIQAPRAGTFGQAANMPGIHPSVAQMLQAQQSALDMGAFKDPKDVGDAFDKTLTFGINLADKQDARREQSDWRRDQAAMLDAYRRESLDARRDANMNAAEARAETLRLQREKLAADKAKLAMGKALPSSGVKELANAGESVEGTKRLRDTFKTDYGGKTILGGMSNTLGRIFGDETGQAQWWQDMEQLQNQTRHDLFGSALTKTELDAWNKTSVNPRMHPNEIAKNLQRRQEIEARAASKLARSYRAAGYNESQIREILGDAAEYLDAPAEKPGGGPARVKSDADWNRLPSGALYIAPDGKTRRKQ